MDLNALIVTTDRIVAGRLSKAFEQTAGVERSETHTCHALDAALRLASHYAPNFVFVDERYGVDVIRPLLNEIRLESPKAIHIMLTATGRREAMADALRAGACDCLSYNDFGTAAIGHVLWGVRRLTKQRTRHSVDAVRRILSVDAGFPLLLPVWAGVLE